MSTFNLPNSFSAGIRQLLVAAKNEFNADLIDAYLKGDGVIETQANIRTDIGTPKTKGLPNSKTLKYRVDGNWEFKNIRYPYHSMDEPEWDSEPGCRFPFDQYLQEIGTTWFAQSGSLRWGYDIDAVFGHKSGRGVSDAELRAIQAAIQSVDYAELRRSTSGKGLHLYILATGIQLANHTEHAAAGRALLGRLCLDAGLDFAPQVDCVGGNMWIWSRRANLENRGFEVLKPASRVLTPDDLPSNWRDHLEVVQRKRSRIRVPSGDEDQWAELATKTTLDAEHKRILAAYQKTNFVLTYNPDFHCWYGHTAGFAEVHESLKLKGFFRTNSPATEPDIPNCYVFLRPDGMLFIVRFKTQDEDPSWGKTAGGERCCFYNRPIDLKTACQAVGGVWMGGACTCHRFQQAAQLTAMFGFSLPSLPSDRPVNFKYQDAYTIAAETAKVNGEAAEGWGIGYRKLVVTFEIEATPQAEHDYDSVARHVVTAERENAGWLMLTDTKEWTFEPKETVLDRVCHRFGISGQERAPVAGRLAGSPYKLVNEPYQPEFLPGRQWNKFGAQLAVAPTYGGTHPHYDKILRHIGMGLEQAVRDDPWCGRNGIVTGYDFLLLWCALVIRDPKQHLPMLYLYSKERDNGKSALYKALGLLFARGYVEGVRMLNEKFNKMMAGAVLIYLDEEKVSRESAQKVKLYIDADKVSLRLMRTDSFMFSNFSHWIACYNFTDGVPVEDGDERVIMIEVPILYDEDKDDWKEVMLPGLESEKSDFLGTLTAMEIPLSGGRLHLPVLSTPLKEKIMAEDRAADNPPCNREELLIRIDALVKERKRFSGPSRELAEALGPGSWSGSLNHLRRYLREIEPQLCNHGIRADLSNDRLIILEVVTPSAGISFPTSTSCDTLDEVS